MKVLAALGVAAVLALGAPAAAASSVVNVNDSNDGGAVTLHPGDTLTVTLGTPQWTIDAPQGTGLVASGDQTTAVTRPGPGAPGTTSRTFRATAVGRATVDASRTSCGEALRCTPAQAGWAIVVHVVAKPVTKPVTLPFTGAPIGTLLLVGCALLTAGGTTQVLASRIRTASRS